MLEPDDASAGLTPPPLPSKAATAEVPPASPPMNLKPRQGTFMFRRVLIGLLASLCATLLVTVILILAEGSLAWALLLFIASSAVAFYAALVAYRKERYEIHDHRILCHRGPIVTTRGVRIVSRVVSGPKKSAGIRRGDICKYL